MKNTIAITVLLLLAAKLNQSGNALLTAQSTTGAQSSHRLAASMQKKVDHIQSNGERAQPDPTPTVMTEEEVNDYFAAGKVNLPQGVKKISFQGQSGVVTAFLTVDFDEIRAGQRSSNPLLSMFSGTHDVRAEGDVAGAKGTGTVHIRSISIDGIEVPRMALEFFISRYIKPKYPNVGIDSSFKMTNRIDTATVGYHKITIVQK